MLTGQNSQAKGLFTVYLNLMISIAAKNIRISSLIINTGTKYGRPKRMLKILYDGVNSS